MTKAYTDEENLKKAGGATTPCGIKLNGWVIESSHGVMMKDNELEDLKQELGDAFKTPEIVFGKNHLRLEHPESGFEIHFDAVDALKQWTKDNLPPLQVKIAEDWQRERHQDIKTHEAKVLSYDWTFSSSYVGSFNSKGSLQFKDSEDGLDYELLRRKDPILFYDSIPLYESELDDNGLCQFEVLVRVMEEYWFVISRFFLRVDNCLTRLRESRLFSKFTKDSVVVIKRDLKHWECTNEELQEKLSSCSLDLPGFRDPSSAAESLRSLYPNGTHLNLHQESSVCW